MRKTDRLDSLYHQFPDSVAVLDDDENIVYCNPSFALLLQHQHDEIIGRPFLSFFDSMSLYSQLGLRKILADGPASDLRLTLANDAQEPLTLSVSASKLIADTDDDLSGFLIIGRNDSIIQEHMRKEAHYMAQELEQKKALEEANKSLAKLHAELANSMALEREQQNELLSQSTRLATLGELIGSIGHEINTPLMLINMNSELKVSALNEIQEMIFPIFGDEPTAQKFKAELEKKFGGMHELFKTTLVASKRLQELSLALRNRARVDSRPQPVLINDVVDESLTISMGKLKAFELEKTLAENVGEVTCRQSQIGQVITNLLSNAADAVTEAKQTRGDDYVPTIAIATEAHHHSGVPGVRILIGDNGRGVSEEDRTKIFERYFTTKPSGQGTGLGLSLISTIIRDHNGLIDVMRDPILGGARFEVWLPLIPQAS